MEQHFNQIKKSYDEFYNLLLRKGRLPYRDTRIGLWGPSVTEELFTIFKRFKLERYKCFLDLGSGDGKAALLASLFTMAEGVEYDTWLFNVSRNMQRKLSHIPGVKRVVFHNKDFMKHDIKDYDIVFIAPDKPMHRGIERKLLSELNGKLIHYGHHFQPRLLFRELSFRVDDTLVSVYSNIKRG